MKLADARAIVSGAARGIGRHVCLELCRAGAGVAGLDVNRDGLEELRCAHARLASPGPLTTCVADVSREADVAAAVRSAAEALGGINTLINCAGIYRDGLLVRRVGDGDVITMPLQQWQRVIDVDLTGTFLLTRQVAAHMVGRQIAPAVIVNVSSVSHAGFPGQGNYSAAKAGVVVDAHVWSQELARYGIRVASIAPGFIDTPLLEDMPADALRAWVERVPVGRLGTTEEIWLGVRFILECEYFNGKCLEIDGGLRA